MMNVVSHATVPRSIPDEEFGRGDADVIFVHGGVGEDPDEQASERLSPLREDPLLSRLGAVRSGNIYPVSAHWFRATSPPRT